MASITDDVRTRGILVSGFPRDFLSGEFTLLAIADSIAVLHARDAAGE